MKLKKQIIIDLSWPRKVGRYYEDLNNPLSYQKVECDEENWVDCSKYLPADFDLVWCKIENHPKILAAWHTGNSWDGYKVKQNHKILYWKTNQNF